MNGIEVGPGWGKGVGGPGSSPAELEGFNNSELGPPRTGVETGRIPNWEEWPLPCAVGKLWPGRGEFPPGPKLTADGVGRLAVGA